MPVYLGSALANFSDTGHPYDTERCAGGAVLEMRAPEVYLAEDGDAIAMHMLGETDREAAACVEAVRKEIECA